MRRWLTIVIVAMFAITLAACGNTKEQSKESKDEVVIEHALGKTSVAKNPKNIIVFDYGALDTLDELGIEVTGVSKQTLPPYLDKYQDDQYENIGSLKEPDFDKIANIDPDLILISDRQAEQYDELSKLGPTINVGIDPVRYMDSFTENLEKIGVIFDKEDVVEEKLADINKNIDSVKALAQDKDLEGLIILANDDKISAYGTNSRFGFIHDVLGIKPVDEKIEAATHGMNVSSSEYIPEKDPDILYVIDRSAAIGEGASAKELVENKLVERTKAYKNDRIIYLDPYNWYLSGGGLQSVPKMIEEIEASLK